MAMFYFKLRRPFDFSPHRFAVGRPFANNRRFADNFFILKVCQLDGEEYAAFYNFHFQRYLKASPQGEQEIYEHVWFTINMRVNYYQRQSPFSSNQETNVENIQKFNNFKKILNRINKTNARPHPKKLPKKK